MPLFFCFLVLLANLCVLVIIWHDKRPKEEQAPMHDPYATELAKLLRYPLKEERHENTAL